jgi:hypothetical protein
MATTITAGNATNGLAFSADNAGILELKTGTGAGTTALTLNASQNATFAGTVTSPTGTLYPLVSGTAVTASGTSVNFTSIPATAKRITVMLNGVSGSGTSNLQVQIGSTTFTTSGYTGGWMIANGGGLVAAASATSGAVFDNTITAAELTYANITITNITGNTWIIAGTKSTSVIRNGCMTYTVSLGGVLDRVRVTTINGTDTFDAGSINILWE